MNFKLHIFSLFLSGIFILFVVNKVRKDKFSEKESLFWVFGGGVAFVISMFPYLLEEASKLIGVSYPPALLFLVAVIFLFVITFILTLKISELSEKNKELAQTVSLMELQNMQHEGKVFIDYKKKNIS